MLLCSEAGSKPFWGCSRTPVLHFCCRMKYKNIRFTFKFIYLLPNPELKGCLYLETGKDTKICLFYVHIRIIGVHKQTYKDKGIFNNHPQIFRSSYRLECVVFLTVFADLLSLEYSIHPHSFIYRWYKQHFGT